MADVINDDVIFTDEAPLDEEIKEEDIDVQEIVDFLKSKGMDIRSLAREAKQLNKEIAAGTIDPNAKKAISGKKTVVRTGPEFELVLADYPDICIKKTTKTTEKLLVIMPSCNGFYIKDMKANTTEPLNSERYSKFTSGMEKPIELPKDFWIDSIYGGKTFYEVLFDSKFLKDENTREIIKLHMLPQVKGSYMSERGYSNRNCLYDIDKIKTVFSENKYLCKEYYNKMTRGGSQTKSSQVVRGMIREYFLNDIVETFGLDNTRDFLDSLDLSLVEPNFENSSRYGAELDAWRRVSPGYQTMSSITHKTSWTSEDTCRPPVNMDYNTFKEYVLYESVKMGYARSMRTFWREWSDDLQMQIKMYGKIKEKYPKDLPLHHAILSYKVALYGERIDEEGFKKQSDFCQNFEGKYKNYIFITPRIKQDMIEEAQMQANCLASYTGKYAAQTSMIFFMRKKMSPEESYITIELNEIEDREKAGEKTLKLSQRYLAHNRTPKDSDCEIINKWYKRCVTKYKQIKYPDKYKTPEKKKSSNENDEMISSAADEIEINISAVTQMA